MNGKGSNRRQQLVSAAEYAANYERIFGPPQDERPWGFAIDRDEEYWHGGTAVTREEVIEEARDHFTRHAGANAEKVPRRFYICRCTPVPLAELLPSGEAVVEKLAEDAHDEWGMEDDTFWSATGLSDSAVAELDAAIKAWAHKHLNTVRWWIAADIEEVPWPERMPWPGTT